MVLTDGSLAKGLAGFQRHVLYRKLKPLLLLAVVCLVQGLGCPERVNLCGTFVFIRLKMLSLMDVHMASTGIKIGIVLILHFNHRQLFLSISFDTCILKIMQGT
jgi:hypothetical protein